MVPLGLKFPSASAHETWRCARRREKISGGLGLAPNPISYSSTSRGQWHMNPAGIGQSGCSPWKPLRARLEALDLLVSCRMRPFCSSKVAADAARDLRFSFPILLFDQTASIL